MYKQRLILILVFEERLIALPESNSTLRRTSQGKWAFNNNVTWSVPPPFDPPMRHVLEDCFSPRRIRAAWCIPKAWSQSGTHHPSHSASSILMLTAQPLPHAPRVHGSSPAISSATQRRLRVWTPPPHPAARSAAISHDEQAKRSEGSASVNLHTLPRDNANALDRLPRSP